MLVAPPKMGKSSLILNILLSITSNCPVLDYYKPVPAIHALYLALESSKRRLNHRTQLIVGKGVIPRKLETCFDYPRMETGGLQQLKDYLEYNPCDVVVIDTLGTFQTGAVSYSYNFDQQDIDKFKQVSSHFDVPIILVHHTRKSKSDDWVDMCSGTHGISGTVDTLLYLQRPRESAIGRLYVTGRDVAETSYTLRSDVSNFRWTMLGPHSDQYKELSTIKRAILHTLSNAEMPMTPSQLAVELDRSSGVIRVHLCNLVADGLILREDRGKYVRRVEY